MRPRFRAPHRLPPCGSPCAPARCAAGGRPGLETDLVLTTRSLPRVVSPVTRWPGTSRGGTFPRRSAGHCGSSVVPTADRFLSTISVGRSTNARSSTCLGTDGPDKSCPLERRWRTAFCRVPDHLALLSSDARRRWAPWCYSWASSRAGVSLPIARGNRLLDLPLMATELV